MQDPSQPGGADPRRGQPPAAQKPAPVTPPPGQPPPPTGPPGATPPVAADAATDPHERIDGLRSWIATVERRLGIRTIAIGIVSVLALAAGIVAIVLARGAEEDAATEADLQDVREQLAAVEETASQAAEEPVETLTQRIEALEDEIAAATQGDQSVEQQLNVIEDDIQDLRDQIAELEGATTTTPEPP
jgi:septal ring factor EnvC (AmiA/AmiB activator)